MKNLLFLLSILLITIGCSNNQSSKKNIRKIKEHQEFYIVGMERNFQFSSIPSQQNYKNTYTYYIGIKSGGKDQRVDTIFKIIEGIFNSNTYPEPKYKLGDKFELIKK